ncbi:MAG: hypothetical protein HYW47_05735 [Deltaproteobacteria bacterium]|nr:hypothetical protein [Deltaproteobacteria bacterium]
MIISDMPHSQPILIIAALKEELKDLKGHLKNLRHTSFKKMVFFSGELENTKVILVQSGVGLHRAARATRAALEIVSPRCIILTGFCGGTHTDLQPGDIVLSEKLILNADTLRFYTSHENFLNLAKSIKDVKIVSGKTLTTQEPILTAKRKQELGKKLDCLAINMEGYGVAEVAHKASIPFIEMRVVLDPAHEDVPDISSKFFFFKKRFQLKKLKKNSDTARASLTPYLVSFIKNL